MFPLFWGVPLVLRWYAISILGFSAGLPGDVQLFRHSSGMFHFFAGVPCFVVPCSGVPGFIVCRIFIGIENRYVSINCTKIRLY